MNPKERTAILSFIEKNGKIETDIDTWFDLDLMSTTPDTMRQFSEINLPEYRHLLTTADIKDFAATQAVIKNGDSDVSSLVTFGAQMSEAFTLLGIDTSKSGGKEDRLAAAKLSRLVRDDITSQETMIKKKLDQSERQLVIDEWTDKFLTGRKNTWWFGMDKTTDEESTIDQIPDATLDEITDYLRLHDLPISPGMIIHFYREKLKGEN